MPNGTFRRSAFLAAAGMLTAALADSPPAHAQTELQGIVIEGVSLDATPQQLSSVGSAVTVVTGEQLQRQQVRNTADALRSLPGVHVGRTGAFGGLTEVRLRGAESNHTLVLIDGVVANATTNGLFSFSDLAIENIERIEVIRGPQSGLYGATALAGVVNIVTRARRGPVQLSLRGEAGSLGTDDVTGNISGGNDRIYGDLTIHRRTTDGFNIAPEGSEEDSAEQSSVFFKGGVRPTQNLSLDVMVRHSSKKGDRDTEGGSAGTLAVQVDNPSHFSTDFLVASARATWETFDGRWVHKFEADANDTSRQDTSISTFGTFFSQNDSETNHLRYLSTMHAETPRLGKSTHKLTGLVERELEGFTPVTVNNVTQYREAVSVAADYHGEFFNRLGIHAAIRHDDNDTVADFTTYRVAGSLRVPHTPVRVHGSAGTGVKFPTMFEQFGVIPTRFVPNPNLTPEESFGWDAGAEVTLFQGRAVVDVTWFEADLENEITTIFLPGFLSTVRNLTGTSQRQGLEVAARFALTDKLTVGGAYTHLIATEPSGIDEIRRPEHSGQLDINYVFAEGRGNVNAHLVYNGEMQDQAFLLPFFTATRTTLEDYLLVSLAGSYEIRPGLELFGRVENLLDEDYQEVYGFESPGATAFGGIRLTLGGEEGLIR